MRRALLAVVVVAVGCSAQSDDERNWIAPNSIAVAPGTEMIVKAHPGFDSTVALGSKGQDPYAKIADGVKVKVVEDEAFDRKLGAKGHGSAERYIRVLVTEGPHRGQEWRLTRGDLRVTGEPN